MMHSTGPRIKPAVLLYHLLKGKTFRLRGLDIKLGGDLLDLAVVIDKDRLQLPGASFRDFLRLAHELDDRQFEALKSEMLADFKLNERTQK